MQQQRMQLGRAPAASGRVGQRMVAASAVSVGVKSRFDGVEMAPPDPILGKRRRKLLLGLWLQRSLRSWTWMPTRQQMRLSQERLVACVCDHASSDPRYHQSL
jgi:hypothetical protein